MLAKMTGTGGAYFGSPDRGGKRGRGTGKTPAAIAVQVDEKGRPVYAKAVVADNLQGASITDAAHKIAGPGSEIRTDGYKPYGMLSDTGYVVMVKRFGPQGSPDHSLWLHKIISNMKAFITGTYHGLDKKHLQRYFDEPTYRFNGRHMHPQLFMRLLNACALVSAITYKEITA
jgi:hypothetical protein